MAGSLFYAPGWGIRGGIEKNATGVAKARKESWPTASSLSRNQETSQAVGSAIFLPQSCF